MWIDKTQPRSPLSNTPPRISLSADFLGGRARPTFGKILTPTVLDRYVVQEDPWTADLESALHGWSTGGQCTSSTSGAYINHVHTGCQVDDPCGPR